MTQQLDELNTSISALIAKITEYSTAVQAEFTKLASELTAVGTLSQAQLDVISTAKTNVDNATAALQAAQAQIPTT